MEKQSIQQPRAIFLRGLLRVEGRDFQYRDGEFWFSKKIITGDELAILWVNSFRCIQTHVYVFNENVNAEEWHTVFDADQDRPLGW